MTRKMKDSGLEWIGQIPEDWKISKIKYYAMVIMGQSPSSDNYNLDGIGEPFLQGNADFTDKYPIERVYTSESNKSAEIDDILLSVRAPVGAKNIANKKYAIGRGLCALRAKDINKDLLWYMIDIINKEFEINSKGSTYDSVTVSDVNNASFVIGSHQEQMFIADYLDKKCSKIDNTIEKEKQVIEKLKEYKQSVITEAVTKGLNPNVKMKDSGVEWIGEIPKHWEIRKLKSIAKTIKGYAFKVEMFSDSGIPVVKASDLKKQTVIRSGLFINPEVSNNYLNFKLLSNDILMSTVGSTPDVTNSAVGQLALVPRELDGSLLNQNVVKLIPNENVYNLFLFYYLFTHAFRKYLDLIAHGTANQASLTLKDILDYNIPVPNLKEQLQISDYLDKKCTLIDKAISNKENLIQKLTEYKKSLIYECVTGKREV